jgi:hypothetical protein
MSWGFERNWKMQGENESIEINPRRKPRNPEQIAQLVREFRFSGLTQRGFAKARGQAERVAAESENRSTRKHQTQADGREVEADEQSTGGLELLIGQASRIRIGAGFCATTLRRLLEVQSQS